MKFFDRLLTIVITATITSVIWIVFGTTFLEMAEDKQDQQEEAVDEGIKPAPQQDAPEPQLTPSAPPISEPSPSSVPTVSNPVVQPLPTATPIPQPTIETFLSDDEQPSQPSADQQ